MAQRVFNKYPRSIYRGTKRISSNYNYLLVTDFEATCKEYEKIQPQEIIEFPCAAVSTKDWKVKNVFHEYVKPRVHPTLSSFCTELTGIVQEMVEDQPYFPEVFHKFCSWLDEHNYFKEDNACAFVTCGDWDLRVMLPEQCNLDNITLPVDFRKWINLKCTFCEATQYYPRSLKDMFSYLKFPMEGRLHSGIDDVNNMVKIIQALSKYNIEFKVNSAPDIVKQLLADNKLS